jgi:hypothetical protein
VQREVVGLPDWAVRAIKTKKTVSPGCLLALPRDDSTGDGQQKRKTSVTVGPLAGST